MTTTVIILTIVVSLVAAFAGALVWAQLHALRAAPAADAPRPKRRPF